MLNLQLAIFWFNEPFGPAELTAFAFIAAALGTLAAPQCRRLFTPAGRAGGRRWNR